jgi:hypothetical protein
VEENLTRRSFSKLLLPAGGAVLGTATAPSLLAQAAASDANNRGAGIYNVRTSGARGDGKTLDTAAIQRAIDTCHADGGGVVLIPAGTFVIGTVELKSNVTLHIAAAGKLLGSASGKDYHAVQQIPLLGDTTLEDGNWALLFAVGAKNIAIEGPGTIDGQGASFRSEHGKPAPSNLSGNNRPYHILLHKCEGVSLRNLSLVDSAYHSVRIIQSSRIHIDHVYIHNRVNGNNDGFHFISAQHVALSNCTVKSQDDACAMFGSCQYITITNSSFSTRWSVFRFGGGIVQNIAISNCLMYEVDGCPIKFQGNPGDRFENISFSNLLLDRVTGPISISIGANTDDTAKGQPPIARRISFNNVQGTIIARPPDTLPESELGVGARAGERNSCIVLNAIRGAVLENICFDNVHLTFSGGGTAEDAAVRSVPLVSGEYFKLGTLPAYALYARNVRGLTLQNVRFQMEHPDLRPAVVLNGVEDLAANALSVQADPRAEAVLRCTACRQILLSALRILTPSTTLLALEGPANAGIIVDGGDLSKVATPAVYRDGATDSSVTWRNMR